MKNNKFKDAVIAVTYKCNSKCIMCGIWKSMSDFNLPKEEYKKLPKNLKHVNISGGEPFLREDLVDVIKIIKKTCPRAEIIISSNGFAAKEIEVKLKEILKIAPNIGVTFSLDGLNEVHGRIRGISNAFDKVYSTILLSKKLGVKNIKVAFTISNNNITELKNVYKFSQGLGIGFSLSAVHNIKNYDTGEVDRINSLDELKNQINFLIRKELKSLNPKDWIRAYYAYGLYYFIKNNKRLLPEYSGRSDFFLDAHGYIYSSNISTSKIKNIQEVESFDFIQCNSGNAIPPSWMVCTARSAIKKHFIKVGFWILINKIKTLFGRKDYLK